MSADQSVQETEFEGEIRYEISVSDDVVSLDIRNGGDGLSVATDPESARLLASDILAAADETTTDSADSNQFVFGR